MYYYSYPPKRRRKSHKGKLIFLFLLFLAAIGSWKALALGGNFSFSGSTDRILGVIKKESRPIDQVILTAKLQSYLASYEANGWKIGLYVQDYKTGSTFTYVPDSQFESASLTKLPVLLTLYDDAQNGRIAFDQSVQVLASDVQNYGTTVMPYKGPGTTYTYAELAWYLANRSDNTAFQTLSRVLGEARIDKNMHDWGFQITGVNSLYTTPREIARVFDLLYNCKIVKGHYCEEMKSLLTKTNEESRIPGLLPTDVRVIHKTGNAIGGLQDAGVVELTGRPYSIAILNDNVGDETSEEQTMAQISKEIYDYIKSLD